MSVASARVNDFKGGTVTAPREIVRLTGDLTGSARSNETLL
jgi:hypothetical protein